MKKIYYIVFLIGLLAIGISCKQDIIPVFDANEHAVNIWFGNRSKPADSTIYNFAFRPDRPVDSIMFNASVMGIQNGKTFPFTLKAIGGDTVRIKEGVHYRFGNYVLGNGTQYTVSFPIYILRTKDFVDKELNIVFGINESSTTKAGGVEYGKLKLTMLDKFTKPANWDADATPYAPLTRYFGVFSRAKFQFITDITGVAPTYKVIISGGLRNPEDIYATQATDYKNTCKTELAAYNATHPTPLKDENGIAISF